MSICKIIHHSTAVIIKFLIVISIYSSYCEAQLSVTPPSLPKPVGNSFFVTCKVEGNVKARKIKWISPSNEEIPSSGNPRTSPQRNSMSSLELFFKNIRQKDSGDYLCKATLVNGEEISFSYRVEVYRSITFTNAPKTQYGPEGSDHVIKCVAKSEPPPEITWYYDERNSNGSKKYELVRDGLKIYNVDRKDEGEYTCSVKMYTSEVSEFRQQNINFNVQYPPECDEMTKSTIFTHVGSKVKVQCGATALPRALFTWTHHGNEITNNSKGFEILSYNESSELQILVEDSSMFGEYVCNASNFLGQCSIKVNVSEVDKPGIPDVVKITNFAGGSIKIVVDPPKSQQDNTEQELLALTKIKVQYRKFNESWEAAKTKHFDIGSNPYVIKSLEHEAQYVVRVAAGSAVGYGNYSEEQVYKLIKMDVSSAEHSANPTSICLILFVGISLLKF